ncbi:DUF1574 family protein [Chitinophaga sp. LS1]|uniref:DUF1574 family protein n=1 Tax=Chitinophaga sp. LS1 TaxID=3051176 RepID=UPI002AAB47E7|nr:DUF1574 family protein [Chitinophaga sp. LS1]WPV69032.1 DUF1574 family protein [Chitinophaga sp. LS1]
MMKQFLQTLFIFLIPALLYCVFGVFILPHRLVISNGPNTQQQIDRSFEDVVKEDYELLILGNSRCYRGINPAILSVKAYNFSHDNDSYNQQYYKLQYLLNKRKKIACLVLGVDYFEFNVLSNSRNYAYADYLGKDYERDYKDKVWELKLKHLLENLNPKQLSLLKKSSVKLPFQRENGQYIRYGTAQESDTIHRDIKRLKIQEEYFHKIISLCRENGIKVFLVMPPVRQNELKSYTKDEINEFNAFINRSIDHKTAVYWNFSEDSSFTTKDYTDITHLNEGAADRFSKMLDDSIKSYIAGFK